MKIQCENKFCWRLSWSAFVHIELFVYINWFKWEKFCCRHTHTNTRARAIESKQCQPSWTNARESDGKNLQPTINCIFNSGAMYCIALYPLESTNSCTPQWEPTHAGAHIVHTHTHTQWTPSTWSRTPENAETGDKEWRNGRDMNPISFVCKCTFCFEHAKRHFLPTQTGCFAAHSFKLFKTIMAQLCSTGFYII